MALAAKWPNWDFRRGNLNGLHFVNHSMLGDLVEDLRLDEAYECRDGHGNLLRCHAEWLQIPGGGMLRTRKTGSIGDWLEERTVIGDKLEFVLKQRLNCTRHLRLKLFMISYDRMSYLSEHVLYGFVWFSPFQVQRRPMGAELSAGSDMKCHCRCLTEILPKCEVCTRPSCQCFLGYSGHECRA